MDYVLSEDDLVPESQKCPNCGERTIDQLIDDPWAGVVHCATCGEDYEIA